MNWNRSEKSQTTPVYLIFIAAVPGGCETQSDAFQPRWFENLGEWIPLSHEFMSDVTSLRIEAGLAIDNSDPHSRNWHIGRQMATITITILDPGQGYRSAETPNPINELGLPRFNPELTLPGNPC